MKQKKNISEKKINYSIKKKSYGNVTNDLQHLLCYCNIYFFNVIVIYSVQKQKISAFYHFHHLATHTFSSICDENPSLLIHLSLPSPFTIVPQLSLHFHHLYPRHLLAILHVIPTCTCWFWNFYAFHESENLFFFF